jgi:hypothetical protein
MINLGQRWTASEVRGSNYPRWRGLARAVPPGIFWRSWPPSLTSCALDGSHDRILMPKKSQVKFSSGRSPKRQNTQKRVFLFCRVITKIRGVDGKSP